MNASDAHSVVMPQSAVDKQQQIKDIELLTTKNVDNVNGEKENTMNVSVESEKELQGVKRDASTSSGDSSDTKVKKARSKPKPIIIENMKEYVENNTLEKLTTATLRHWLRQQSIHCTTRDKKADLVEKVCKHFVIS